MVTNKEKLPADDVLDCFSGPYESFSSNVSVMAPEISLEYSNIQQSHCCYVSHDKFTY